MYVRWLRSHVGHAPLLVGAGMIIYGDGKVLLQRRADDDTWAIHGGCLKPGESTEEAANREVREELGITPLSLEFFSIVSGEDMFFRYPNGDEAYIVHSPVDAAILKDLKGFLRKTGRIAPCSS